MSAHRTVTSPALPPLVAALTEARGHEARKPLRKAILDAARTRSPELTHHLDHEDSLTRWEIVNLLGELRDPRVALNVVRFALDEDEVHARWRAFWAVSRFDRGTTVPLLLDALHGDHPVASWRAALMLTLVRHSAAVPYLVNGLASDDEWIQWEALSGLKALAPLAALPSVLPFMEADRPRNLRQEAVLAVGAIGSSAGREALERYLEDADPEIRWRASMGLGRIGDRRSAGPIRSRLRKERHPSTRRQLTTDLNRLEAQDGQTPP